MNRYIDIYCERLEPGLWAEPLNALTNLSFIIAALMAFLLARRENALDWRSGLLIFLTFAMGVGSTLFHTFAQLWAMISDILPILLFQIVFIALYTNRVMGLRWYVCIAVLALFFASMQGAMALPRDWLNGSLEYAPALIFVSAFGLWHVFNAGREKFGLLLAALTFIISLSFRSLDMAVCEALPIGTHFLWHILNGLVLYLSTRAYVLNAPRR